MDWSNLIDKIEERLVHEQMVDRHVSPFPGTVVVRSPVTGSEQLRGRWTWHSRWRLRSYWAWWATHQSFPLEPGHRTRYTTCGSWLWIEHRSTAHPMCHSVSGRKAQRRTRVTGGVKEVSSVNYQGAAILNSSFFSQVTGAFSPQRPSVTPLLKYSWDKNM